MITVKRKGFHNLFSFVISPYINPIKAITSIDMIIEKIPVML